MAGETVRELRTKLKGCQRCDFECEEACLDMLKGKILIGPDLGYDQGEVTVELEDDLLVLASRKRFVRLLHELIRSADLDYRKWESLPAGKQGEVAKRSFAFLEEARLGEAPGKADLLLDFYIQKADKMARLRLPAEGTSSWHWEDPHRAYYLQSGDFVLDGPLIEEFKALHFSEPPHYMLCDCEDCVYVCITISLFLNTSEFLQPLEEPEPQESQEHHLLNRVLSGVKALGNRKTMGLEPHLDKDSALQWYDTPAGDLSNAAQFEEVIRMVVDYGRARGRGPRTLAGLKKQLQARIKVGGDPQVSLHGSVLEDRFKQMNNGQDFVTFFQ